MRYWTWLIKRVIIRIPILSIDALKFASIKINENQSGIEFTLGMLIGTIGPIITLITNQISLVIISLILAFILLTHSFYLDEVKPNQ